MKNKIFIILIATAGLTSCNSGSGPTDNSSFNAAAVEIPKTPEQLRAELKQQEQTTPAEYLSADGTYRENFWGDKLKINCTIHNKATLASFKDIVVRVRFYTKTKTELGSKEYTIYEIVNANSKKTVEMKIDTYKDVAAIGWDVVSATALN
jgi:hypothetical protein